MKKLLMVLLVFAITLSCCLAFANDSKVEINFCVGDDTLLINGTSVQVEKPYVVGEGVTLVPLRVITEAFGSTVTWEESTQTINISYPDVDIVLQIGNPIAEVNGKPETLLAAPELPVDTTMVPLRFISETFGAVVSYDETTERITVIKDNQNGTEIVVGTINNAFVGDSYYNWSIKNPVDMNMEERVFDGTYTCFSYDDENWIDISIAVLGEDYDFDRDFVEFKNSFQEYTLIKAEKITTNPKAKVMLFQAKDKTEFLNIKIIITDKYAYLVYGVSAIAEKEYKEKITELVSSFELSFNKDAYDLSEIESGYRKFKSDSMKLSFLIPQDYYLNSSEDYENEFTFRKMANNDDSSITMVVYSKSDILKSAKDLAEMDFEHNFNNINESISKFSESIYENTYDTLSVYEYTSEINSKDIKEYKRDVFFELGNYIYNIALTFESPNETLMDYIINSVKIEELDFNEVGTLLRNMIEDGETYTAKAGKCTITLPDKYLEQVNNGGNYGYINSHAGTVVLLQVTEVPNITHGELTASTKQIEADQRALSNIEVITSTKDITLNGKKFTHFVIHQTMDTGNYYTHFYATTKNGKVYNFIISHPELTYSEFNRNETEAIVSSLTF